MSISKEKFKEMLREKGLKVTNQRILVLEVLADHRDKHLTAEDIYELVREDYPEIGLATIYRTVQLLLEMQLVDLSGPDFPAYGQPHKATIQKKDIIITI